MTLLCSFLKIISQGKKMFVYIFEEFHLSLEEWSPKCWLRVNVLKEYMYMYMLHVHVAVTCTCTCYMYMLLLHVHVPATCTFTCYMYMLLLQRSLSRSNAICITMYMYMYMCYLYDFMYMWFITPCMHGFMWISVVIVTSKNCWHVRMHCTCFTTTKLWSHYVVCL